MASLLQILFMLLSVVWWIVIIHIIMSWLINFQVLNLQQPLVAQIWYGLNGCDLSDCCGADRIVQ